MEFEDWVIDVGSGTAIPIFISTESYPGDYDLPGSGGVNEWEQSFYAPWSASADVKFVDGQAALPLSIFNDNVFEVANSIEWTIKDGAPFGFSQERYVFSENAGTVEIPLSLDSFIENTTIIILDSAFHPVIGNAANNSLLGSNGIDYILAGGGNDSVKGGSGNDIIYGEADNDSLRGEEGIDKLYGDFGNDTVNGGPGNDSLYGGFGNDSLYGGSANDSLRGEDGIDKLYGGSGNDAVYGGPGNDTLYGEDGNDTLYGGSANDNLFGYAGNDNLEGGSGNDTVNGGSGNDRLIGYYDKSGAQYDTLLGGAGTDTFLLSDSSKVFYLSTGYATTTDFQRSEGDKFQVKGSIAQYSLNKNYNFGGTSTLDTAIYYGSDLIGVVRDTTNVYLPQDFVSV